MGTRARAGAVVRKRPASVGVRPAAGRAGAARLSPLLTPMLATIGRELPAGPGWIFEHKYDGVRALALVDGDTVALISRNGIDKAPQFPEVARALRALGREAARPLVLDGEIVAMGPDGPLRFQALQGRIHTSESARAEREAERAPAVFIAFDLLMEGDDTLLAEPWRARRTRLERLVAAAPAAGVQLSSVFAGDPARLLDVARREGWEGLVAKRDDAPYVPGERTRSWLKLKAERRQEFVIGGWSEPRNSREHLGALIVGYYEGDRLVYAGHVGTGFTRETLRAVYERLKPLERARSPFAEVPPSSEPAHWVTPRLLAEVRYNEFTADGKLRHPVFIGLRDDKPASDVRREPDPSGVVRRRVPRVAATATAPIPSRAHPAATARTRALAAGSVIAQIEALAAEGGAGVLELGDECELRVTNLNKVLFPRTRTAKGDLMRYYAGISPLLLPAIADRPLVLKRYPNGVNAPAFYQQRAPDRVPDGVRAEIVDVPGGSSERRFVGGSLITLLHLVQLGAISVDPWHSRVGALAYADYTIIDLDPGPRATFRHVVEVAQVVKEELDRLALHALLKTSGASGLHVVVPLAEETPLDAARLVAELVARRTVERLPRLATVERSLRARAATAVYVDYLQNIRGKTVASVYSVRARPTPTVSTPLRWDELTPALDPRAFTIETVPARVRATGDLWARAMGRRNALWDVLQESHDGLRR